jgi:hypothetical protein
VGSGFDTRFIGYASGGSAVSYSTPNITHTSGLLTSRQFFTVIITGKLPDSLSGTGFIWNSLKKSLLRLTVSQSISLGVEPQLRLMTRYLLLFDSYGRVFLGRPR